MLSVLYHVKLRKTVRKPTAMSKMCTLISIPRLLKCPQKPKTRLKAMKHNSAINAIRRDFLSLALTMLFVFRK